MKAERVPGLNVFVDGLAISPDSIGMPPMNYGQLVTGWKLIPYRLEVPLASVLPLIQSCYDDLLRTMLLDPPEEDFPADRELRDLGMPSLVTVPAALVGNLVVESLYMDFLGGIGGSGATTYVYSSLDNSRVVWTSTLVFEGTAYRMPNR